jgi:site-specific DNA recombinase
MNAVIYLRVSTEEQSQSGLGLEAQETACRSLAGTLGASEVLLFTDAGISGSKGIEDRPGLTEALATLRKGDVLIVAKRDRIARDMLVTLTVEKVVAKRGARLLSVAGEGSDSDGVTGLILRTMTDLFAQVERETIRSRTRSALQVKKAKAERVGAIPYGFRLAEDGTHLIESEREQRIIALVQSLREDGLSLRAIVAKLNADSVSTRTGNVWQLTQVARILK